jgi:hypothetical protein
MDMPNGQGRAQATLIGTVMEAIRARIASRALTPSQVSTATRGRTTDVTRSLPRSSGYRSTG